MNIGSGRSVAVMARETIGTKFGQNLGQRYAEIGLSRLEKTYDYSIQALKHAQDVKQNSTFEIIADTGKSPEEFINNIKNEMKKDPLSFFNQIVTKTPEMKKSFLNYLESHNKSKQQFKSASSAIIKAYNTDQKILSSTKIGHSLVSNTFLKNLDKIEKIMDEIRTENFAIQKATDQEVLASKGYKNENKN